RVRARRTGNRRGAASTVRIFVTALFAGYFRSSVSPSDAFSEVVVVLAKYQRQLPDEVAVTLVLIWPTLPVVTVQ
ncbi:hypothetical protein ACFXGR_44250, partial [Streptomyces mirabilis]|uniref:hypothetical protein n=1 Tax=Streptomyces mirabilis TaxID=68239 RepID=UPI0036A70184